MIVLRMMSTELKMLVMELVILSTRSMRPLLVTTTMMKLSLTRMYLIMLHKIRTLLAVIIKILSTMEDTLGNKISSQM